MSKQKNVKPKIRYKHGSHLLTEGQEKRYQRFKELVMGDSELPASTNEKSPPAMG